jgi:rare lipoprotein A
MSVPKSILVWATTGLVLGTAAAPSTPHTYPTVFGYQLTGRQAMLTEDGIPCLATVQLKSSSSALKHQMNYLSRTLNELRQNKTFRTGAILPIITRHKKVLHYEIWHQDTFLMRVEPDWQKPGESRLQTLVRLTNGLRKNTGGRPLSVAQVQSKTHNQQGKASWYGGSFHGRLTANGERYDIGKLTAAHKKLPFGTRVLVTNTQTQKSVVVKINDRGPFVSERIIDLSPAAFKQIGNLGKGVMSVKLTVLSENA